jgi:hypothetical protein
MAKHVRGSWGGILGSESGLARLDLYVRKTSINVRTMVSNAIEALYIFDSNQFVSLLIERQGLY